jgi:hypothetical protein
MPSGAHYRIQTAIGKQDNIVTALEHLKKRLRSLKETKEKSGFKNTKPTLSDLEESHVFFLRRRFRPFLLLANEYLRLSATGGVSLGTPCSISIDMYGDYLADIAVMISMTEGRTNDQTDSDSTLLKGFKYVNNLVPAMIKTMEFSNQSIAVSRVPGEYFYVYENLLCPYNHLSSLSRMFAETHYDPVMTAGAVTLAADGPELQTFAQEHAGFELCIPAPFFFCESISSAIPICAFPTTKKEVKIEFNDLDHITNRGYSMPKTSDTNLYSIGVQDSWAQAPTIRSVDLWVDYVFLPTWLAEIVSERVSFFLIRNVSMSQGDITQSNGYFEPTSNYPIEYMFVGFCPTAHVNQVLFEGTNATAATVAAGTTFGKDYFNWTTDDGGYLIKTLSARISETYFYKEVPAVLANSYFFLKFGGDRINSPKSRDLYMLTFAAFPGTYQPSGTLNSGRVTGLRVDWTSDVIGKSGYTATIYVFLFYLNFFLVIEGGASLKYSA